MTAPQRFVMEDAAAMPWAERNHHVVELGLAWLRAVLADHIEALRASRPAGGEAISDLAADWLLRGGVARLPRSPSETTRTARAAYEAARTAMRQAGDPAQL